MRGHSSKREPAPLSKWKHINRVMRTQKIGVLALQETHLLPEHITTLEACYGRSIAVVCSSDPARPGAANGVAVVLNKAITNVKNIVTRTLVPGRALLVTIPWHADRVLTILAIYAPTAADENRAFWSQLSLFWDADRRDRPPKPDVVLGDFNLVEDAIDRVPVHADSPGAVEELTAFKNRLLLYDGWRNTFPDRRGYTLLHKSTGSQSRIDRIYCTSRILETASDWMHATSGLDTDHLLTSVKIIDREAPFVGPGRWTMPLFLLHDEVMNTVQRLGLALERELEDCERLGRTQERNPQLLYQTFKAAVIKALRARARVAVPKLEAQIRTLTKQKDTLMNQPSFPDDKDAQATAGLLQERITDLHRLRHERAALAAAARYRLEGETVSKYWSRVNQDRKPRDIIYELCDPAAEGGARTETRSDRMAQLASEYFDRIQVDPDAPTAAEREPAILKSLQAIPRELDGDQQEFLMSPLQSHEVGIALQSAETGKAEGLDGLPYEFWKHLARTFNEKANDDDQVFDVVYTLTRVFNDIEEHGLHPDFRFAEGWLCPLYKKNDRRLIANYRPITLLNADYKIFTKALSNKLIRVAASVIHENQAGFMPNRHIFDQVRLAQSMISYAETMAENGAIVALDQEKAYDRIDHAYLWRALQAFGLPDQFINTVRSLYSNAKTVVIVNGERSTAFRVTRGVRQGDPLSCILFNLAIEPLACMLRQSQLRGFSIPGLADKLIVTLFADDTTVYLSEYDSYADLGRILDIWCKASSARFNIDKTEVIPIGTQEHRTRVIATRRLSQPIETEQIPSTVRIAADGTCIRLLGAFIGNNIDWAAPWAPRLEKINAGLRRWGRCKPSLNGKRLIVNMIAGGMSLYHTRVMGMPAATERALIRTIRDFVWDGATVPPISYDTLCLPIEQGGINLLDIKLRNQAITLTWIRSYLDLTPRRPAWAFVADILFGEHPLRRFGALDPATRVNQFLQTWRTSDRDRRQQRKQSDPSSESTSDSDPETDSQIAPAHTTPLPHFLRELLRTAKKTNTRFEAIKLGDTVKARLPLWYHIGATDTLNRYNKHASTACLRATHGAVTVGDMLRISRRMTDPNIRHHNRRNCACIACATDRRNGCENPAKCCRAARGLLNHLHPKWHPDNVPPADGLTLTTRRRRKNAEANLESHTAAVLFDPSVTVEDDLASTIRAFCDSDATCTRPAHRPADHPAVLQDAIPIYTDGSCINNGDADARAGSGVWFGPDDPRNIGVRVPGEIQSNQAAEVFAIFLAVTAVEPNVPIHIFSDSRYAIEGLTKYHKNWEAIGWIGVENSHLFRPTLYRLRIRTAPTAFSWVKGHRGTVGNEAADRAAAAGARLDVLPDVDLSVAPEFDLTGAALPALTQALAYQGLRLRKHHQPRPRALRRVAEAQMAVRDMCGRMPTASAIWKSMRSHDFERKVADFLFKGMHDALRVGRYWSNIPGYEDRATCAVCGCTDDLRHILLECTAVGQRLVWDLTRAAWSSTGLEWPRMTLESILACGAFELDKKQAKSRLFRILVSESAYLIWKLRCERRIEFKDEREHTPLAVERRWRATLIRRLVLDREMTHHRFEKKALKRSLVEATWTSILSKHLQLPDDWFDRGGVLVGRGAPEGVGRHGDGQRRRDGVG